MHDERCTRCDRPTVPREEFRKAWHALIDNCPDTTLGEARRIMEREFDGRCLAGDAVTCSHPAVDWRARAFAAEARIPRFEHTLASWTAAAPSVYSRLHWIVNGLGELGVKVGNEFLFLYKGRSIVYKPDDSEAACRWRQVGKREFGECVHPLDQNRDGSSGEYTAGTGWAVMPPDAFQPAEGEHPPWSPPVDLLMLNGEIVCTACGGPCKRPAIPIDPVTKEHYYGG